MYTFEIDFETYERIDKVLKTKEGVCEVMPKARITNHEGKYSTNITLVCVHEDITINCGAGAEYCTNCKDKGEVKKRNDAFGKALSEYANNLFTLTHNK